MHLWLAIDLSSQLQDLRHKAERLTSQLDYPNHALSLPLHISLRISFPVKEEDRDAVMAQIRNYYRTLAPFTIDPIAIEQRGNIVWLHVQENESLARIHRDLVENLARSFAIPSHPFDAQFLYHATLFYSKTPEQASRLLSEIRDEPIPERLLANCYLIGGSPSGKAGEYSVFEKIVL